MRKRYHELLIPEFRERDNHASVGQEKVSKLRTWEESHSQMLFLLFAFEQSNFLLNLLENFSLSDV